MATAIATGAINTAVAVFDTNRPISGRDDEEAREQRVAPGAAGHRTSASAARSTPPVRCSASENGIMPAISTRLFQWIEP